MRVPTKSKGIWEYGDFQTPDELSVQIIGVLGKLFPSVASIIEPTCGKGSLLIAAIKGFPQANEYIGLDINALHLDVTRERINNEALPANVQLIHSDFFDVNWNQLFRTLPEPILVIGNPPWVTSSDLGTLQSSNLPEKSNFQQRTGLEALTGKSNFDISEWMLIQLVKCLRGKNACIAMLCKSTVARKLLVHAWQNQIGIVSAKMFRIDAKYHFDAAVDACLLVIELGAENSSRDCSVFDSLESESPAKILGYHNNFFLSNVKTYQELEFLTGEDHVYKWRSGIKHDCSRVMELVVQGNHFVNGNGEFVSLESEFVYPLLKSSDIGNNRRVGRQKVMLVPQKSVGEETHKIKQIAPMTWSYLQKNSQALAKRGSSIYKNRPEFSVFGVGDYTFAPWKVAISGFYKRLNFVIVSPIDNKPVVFDDTVYFLSCSSEAEAEFVYNLLDSQSCKNFLDSMIFWDDKRPITIEILKRLNLQFLARMLGKEMVYLEITREKGMPKYSHKVTQHRLLDKRKKYG